MNSRPEFSLRKALQSSDITRKLQEWAEGMSVKLIKGMAAV
jgi:hypothetical protein